MERINSFKSVTYILSGSLLYIYNGLAGGWTSGLASMFGFYLFIKGLGMLSSFLDETGQNGLRLVKTAAIIGLIASFVDLFPFTGWIAAIGFIAAFIMEIIGFSRLKNSVAIGTQGREGAFQLVIAMILSVVGAAISMFPIFGNLVASIFALVAMFLAFSGWMKIQDGIIGESVEVAE